MIDAVSMALNSSTNQISEKNSLTAGIATFWGHNRTSKVRILYEIVQKMHDLVQFIIGENNELPESVAESSKIQNSL